MRKIMLTVLAFGSLAAVAVAGHVVTSEKLQWNEDYVVADLEKVVYTIDRTTTGKTTVKWELFHATWTHTITDTENSGTDDLSGYGYFAGTFAP